MFLLNFGFGPLALPYVSTLICIYTLVGVVQFWHMLCFAQSSVISIKNGEICKGKKKKREKEG